MDRMGRYRLLSLLGRGGMAEVFLAHEAASSGAERLVVIKRVLSNFSDDRKFIEMFLDETRLATRLSHPNIAHVYEVGEHERRPYLSIELVHGEDLRSLLAHPERRLGPGLAALIAARVAGALHHAHQLTDLQGRPLQVVHRDVSPQNIRISYEGIVKVLDFGIAKAVNNAETTQAGVVKGKYPYMSPEQAEGTELDARSDVFSLGIVLHEMLSYRRLFKGRSSSETLEEVCTKPIPRPSSLEPAVPIELDRIVLRALERDRATRYQSARDLQRELEAFLAEHPTTDSDLESFMNALFGDAVTLRNKLITVVSSQDPTRPQAAPAIAQRPSQEVTEPLVAGTDSVEELRSVDVLPLTSEGPATVTGASGELAHAPSARARRWIAVMACTFFAIAGVLVILIARMATDPPTTRADAGTPLAVSSPPPRAPDAALPRARPPDAALAAVLPDARPARPRSGFGTLTLDARPWAYATVDGRAVGMTPVFRLRLSAGKHRVELHNPERKLRQTIVIEVPSDGAVRKVVQLR